MVLETFTFTWLATLRVPEYPGVLKSQYGPNFNIVFHHVVKFIVHLRKIVVSNFIINDYVRNLIAANTIV